MFVLEIGVLIVVLVSALLASAVTHRLPALAGGPQRWGRSAARRIGAVPASIALALAGWLVTIAIMIPIGLGTRATESHLDRPVFRYVSRRVTTTHSSHFTKVMSTLTIMGNRDVIEVAVLVALLILGIAYGRRWWLPTVAILAVVAMQREGQSLLAHLVTRDRPPVPGSGVFPSGGVSRLIAIFGIITALAIALLPASQRIWHARAWTGLWIFGVIEACTRVYLSTHWLTDAISGLVFGGLLLLVQSTALHALAGTPNPRSDVQRPARRPTDTTAKPVNAVRSGTRVTRREAHGTVVVPQVEASRVENLAPRPGTTLI